MSDYYEKCIAVIPIINRYPPPDGLKEPIEWHSGPPPHVGWWIADFKINGGSDYPLCYWNGSRWSSPANEDFTAEEASEAAKCTYRYFNAPDELEMFWIDYRPKNTIFS